jgi:hypothetical protein
VNFFTGKSTLRGSVNKLPDWYRQEFHDNPILYACAQAGMPAEEALGYLASGYADLYKRAVRLAEHQPVVVYIPERDSDE